VHFALDDDQQALWKSARRFLEDQATSERVRAAMESETGWDAALWTRIATEMGWAALPVPEAHDGLGMRFVDLVPLLEQMGRTLLPSPFFGTIATAVPALLEAGDDALRARWLPAIAAGEATATVAWTEHRSEWDAADVSTAAAGGGSDGWRLTGEKSWVVDGATASLLLVAARDGADTLALFAVESGAAGLSVAPQKTMDATRRLARLTLDGVHATRLPGDAAAIRRAHDMALTALAVEQVGLAQRCLEMAVDYAQTRVQFGRPIGSFQAIKHKCADMMVQAETARSAAWYAAWCASEAPERLSEAAAAAAAYCGEAAFAAAAENVQIHGGIGFTWEHDCHLFLRWHRERYLQARGM
jgi:alkylation response protein AidB-like acyl-CoA dehydrogenase